MDPKRLVRDGYDRLAETYRAEPPADGIRRWFLDAALARIAPGSDVLELGCGAGIDAVELAAERTYTGVDISSAMIAAATERLPNATLIQADLMTLELAPASFDAVVSLYVFGHLPSDEHRPTFERVARWLRRGGRLFASFPLGADDSIEERWIGGPMFFGGIGREATEAGLRDVGFELELSQPRSGDDPNGGTETFLWVIARKT
jgi:cyclopropane fatty-acyl-phospholipid synthase-like methyltransferase